MKVTIDISEFDMIRIIQIGLTPWAQATEEKKKEYNELISLYGSKVLCTAIRNEELK